MTAARSSFRARLTRMLVLVAAVSVVVLAAINTAITRDLLDDAVRNQLITLRDARTGAIERGIARVEASVARLAQDPAVAAAMGDLRAGYVDLADESGTDADADAVVSALEDRYDEEVLSSFDEAGLDHPPASSLVPASTSGRVVQYQYLEQNPFPPGERAEFDEADDGSAYSRAHGEFHPLLRDLAGRAGFRDLLLVEPDGVEVVYSVQKYIDVGTDIDTGPYADTGLGDVLDRLARGVADEATVADGTFYLPYGGTPALFFAAAIRSGAETLGVVVTTLPIDVVTELTTAEQNWEELGLGDTGDVYVVGSDETLRSEPRRWLEDPDSYVARYRDQGGEERVASLMEITGSPVLLQTIDNAAIQAADDDEEYVGRVTGLLGRRTTAAAAPVDVAALDWTVVTEQAVSETDDPLWTYVRRIGVLLLVLLSCIALVGVFMARVLTRPVRPLVDAAGRVADGDLTTEVPDLGRNELGDVAVQIRQVTAQLHQQESTIAEEEQRIDEMLHAVVPDRLVDRLRRGEWSIADALDTATVVAVAFDGFPTATAADQEAVIELASQLNAELDDAAARHGVERVRMSTERQLFVTGVERSDACVADALAFALDVVDATSMLGQEFDVDLTARVGVATGEVATGTVGASQLSFTVWGDPPALAAELEGFARPGEVLVAPQVADVAGDGVETEPVEGLVGLEQQVVAAVSVRRAAAEATGGSTSFRPG